MMATGASVLAGMGMGAWSPPASAQNTPPRIESILRHDPTTQETNADTLTWRITFSEIVQGVGPEDFRLSGTTAGLATSVVAGTRAWDVTASEGDLPTLEGSVRLNVKHRPTISDSEGARLTNLTPTGTAEYGYAVGNVPSVTISAGEDVENEGEDAIFTVTTSEAAPAHGLTVNVLVTEIERRILAENELPYDFVGPDGEGMHAVTIAGGATSATLRVPTTVDALHEDGYGPTNFVRATVAEGRGYKRGENATAELDIYEGGDKPTAFMVHAESGQQVYEEAETITFEIGLSEAHAGVTRAELLAFEMTASPYNDYGWPFTISNVHKFRTKAGETTIFAEAEILNGTKIEETEQFKVNLFRANEGEIDVEQNRDTVTVTIVDTDTVPVGLLANATEVDEGEEIEIHVGGAPRPRSDCDMPFPWYAEITPSGNTEVLTNADAQTVRVPPCTSNVVHDESPSAKFTTVENTSAEENRTVSFAITRVSRSSTLEPIENRLTIPTDNAVSVTVRDDDGTTAAIAAGADVASEGSNATFTVTLSAAAPTGGLTVSVNVEEVERRSRAEGEAHEGGVAYDFVASGEEGTRTVTVAEGATTATVTVPTVADEVHEEGGGPTNYLRASIVDGTGYNPGSPNRAQLDLNEGGNRPTVSFAEATNGRTRNEGDGEVAAVASLSEPFTHAATVRVSTRNGTAEGGTDFFAQDAVEYRFNPGEKTASVPIALVDDRAIEESESFEIAILEAGTDASVSASAGTLTVTITDDDSATLALRTPSSVVPKDGTVTVEVGPASARGTADCHIPFAWYAEITPGGATAALSETAAKTVSVPACATASTTFSASNDAATTDRTVTFTLTRVGTNADFSTTDARLAIPADNAVNVTIRNTAAVGAPTIRSDGEHLVPAVLSVDFSTIIDGNGVTNAADSATYRWQRLTVGGTLVAENIGTGSTYTLTTADVNHKVQVVVEFEDDAGNAQGPLTSAAFPDRPQGVKQRALEPRGLAAETVWHSAMLSWTEPSGPQAHAVEYYEYRRGLGRQIPENTQWRRVGDANGDRDFGDERSVRAGGLREHTLYTFEVRAVTAHAAGMAAAITARTPGNRAPTVSEPLANQTAHVGQAFSFTFPESTFEDLDGDGLGYIARVGSNPRGNSGVPLPHWLRFDNGSRTFSGTPGTTDTGRIPVMVQATDPRGEIVRDGFEIEVRAASTPVATAPLASNIDKGWRLPGRAAHTLVRQRFTTGPEAEGYTLTSVDIARDESARSWTDEARIAAKICTVDESPDTCTSLVSPSVTLRSRAVARFHTT